MNALFLRILNMSITAGWLVLAIIFVRLVLKKAPKALRVVMWAFVGIRLMFPFSFESVLSLIPSAETIPTDILYTEAPIIQSGISVLNEAVNPILTDKLAPTMDTGMNPAQVVTSVASYVWMVGLVLMVLYTVVSYLGIYRKVREAALLEEELRLCDHISTPFILGVIRPRIYLPSVMSERDRGYVIAHERAHLKRRDHWWKPLGFLLLAVHWFNPLLWVAYVLFCRDIELACDEKVIRELGTESKKPYSDALINCSVPRRMIAACPLAFGEVGVKTRIKSVLSYKKPGFWIMLAGAVVCIVVAVCFLSDPPGKEGAQSGTVIGGEGDTGETDADENLVQIPEGPVKYEFKGSADPIAPSVLLNFDGRGQTFSFNYSGFSSYWPVGNYEIEQNMLILHTGDGRFTYVFEIGENELIFDASKSSEIPGYRYSGDSYETTCPVPDGAVFERVELPETDQLIKEPPVLWLYGWRVSEKATIGSYTWNYQDEIGLYHSDIVDAGAALYHSENIVTIERDPSDYALSSIDIFAVSLSFEATPDELTVLAWRQEGGEAVSDVVPLDDLSFRTNFGNVVYEVIAKWNTSEYYDGEVHYGFRFIAPAFDPTS